MFRLGRTGEQIPPIGLGTFGMGGRFERDGSRDGHWIRLIKEAIGMGYRLIDTAEVYGAGHAEELVGAAIRDFDRDDLFIISKISPRKSQLDVLRAGLSVMDRLGTQVDLLLLHVPPADISRQVRWLEKLVDTGVTRYIGVSNFSADQVREAQEAARKEEIVLNQCELSIIYPENLPLLKWCRGNGVTFMAYSPLGQGELFSHPIFSRVEEVARELGRTPAQVALRWVLDQGAPLAVAGSSRDHLKEDLGALGWKLPGELRSVWKER